MSIIESVKDFILKCPFLSELSSIIRIDYLGSEANSFSVEEVPVQTILKTNIDGSTERQFVFTLASVFDYSDEIKNNIDNSGFYEDVQNWLEQCTNCGVLPSLNNGMTPTKIEAQSNGYLFGIEENRKLARYQIQCRMLYDKE